MSAFTRGVARLGALTLIPTAFAAAPVVWAEAHATTPASTTALAVAASGTPQDSRAERREERRREHRRERRQQERARATVASKVQEAATIALRQRGDAYGYGSAGPGAFDCSGLVMYAFHRAGLGGVPRTSDAQAGAVRRIARSDMRRGDLMFFTGSSGVYHAAIFVRWAGQRPIMVHAPGSGQRVRLASPWTSSWFAGTLRRA